MTTHTASAAIQALREQLAHNSMDTDRVLPVLLDLARIAAEIDATLQLRAREAEQLEVINGYALAFWDGLHDLRAALSALAALEVGRG